jgi:dipeptidyl aminopeptidase/acylaminoacyl peptidase
LGKKEGKRLMSARFAVGYAGPVSSGGNGHLLFVREDTLMAQALDSRSFEVVGDAFPVADHVASNRNYGFFSGSNSGAVAYRSGGGEVGSYQLTWFDRNAKELGNLGPPGNYYDLALSPDGKQVAVQRLLGGNVDVWLIDVQRGTPKRFTDHPALDGPAIWSPDGSRIFFGTRRDGAVNIYQRESSGASTESPVLPQSEVGKVPYDVSADGRLLLYGASDPKTQLDLWVLPMDGERKPVPFLQTRFVESHGQFSPPGAGAQRWIAYDSDISGGLEVYVRSYPGGVESVVSKGGGREPRWRPDGKELFYVGPSGQLMSVQVKTAPHLELSAPQRLFQTRIDARRTPYFHYAVVPDGNRFLISTIAKEVETSAITVVLNWQAGIGSSPGGDK